MVFDLPCSVPNLRLGAAGPVLVASFGAWPTGAMLREIAAAQVELGKHHRKVLSVTIIPEVTGVAPGPTTEERDSSLKQSEAVSRDIAHFTAGSAVVILPRGLVAVMVRTFLAALSLVVTASTPLKVFKSLEEAETWFGTLPDAPKLSPGLARAIAVWLQSRPSTTAPATAP